MRHRKDLILRVQKKNKDLLESLFELVLRPTKEFSEVLYSGKSHPINATQNHFSNIVNLANLLEVERGIRKWPLQF
jgi:hypothetical protein